MSDEKSFVRNFDRSFRSEKGFLPSIRGIFAIEMIIKFHFKIADENRNLLKSIESICLVDCIVTLNLLGVIDQNCPRFHCLYISPRAQFEPFSVAGLEPLARKLAHLSSNGIIKTEQDTFSFRNFLKLCVNLKDGKITINSFDFDENCLQNLPRKQIYLHIKDERIADTDLSLTHLDDKIRLETLMKNLTSGNGRELQYLRLESNDSLAMVAYHYMPKLTNLRGLNINVQNLNLNAEINRNYYGKIAILPSLETFTIRMMRFSTSHILEIICASARFKHTLQRFRLINAEFKLKTFQRVINCFYNLQSLQLIGCVFDLKCLKNMVKAIKTMNNLTDLKIKISDSSDENHVHQYCPLSFPHLKQIIQECSRLQTVYLEANFTEMEFSILNKLASKKNISFTYEMVECPDGSQSLHPSTRDPATLRPPLIQIQMLNVYQRQRSAEEDHHQVVQ